MAGPRNFCDGTTRRDVLRIGSLGVFGSAVLGTPWPTWADSALTVQDTGVSVIWLFLKGGLSTIDTFDLKPNAPAEIRGDFQGISTNVAGVEVCEHLPHVARQCDKFSLVRSFGHRNSDHGPADHYMLTGYHPVAGF